MCFSAESSFTSATLLAGLSYASAIMAQSKRQYPLVIFPVVFTLMQLVEGFVWLASDHGFFPSIVLPIGAYFFLFISHFYWPLIVPFACFVAETNVRRKKILKGILIGVCLIELAVLGLEITAPAPPSINIVGHSIQYTFSTFTPYPFLEKIKGFVLLIVLVGTAFVSSLPGRWAILITVAGSFFAAFYFYNYAFTSVWCFFATIVSVVVLVIIHTMNKRARLN